MNLRDRVERRRRDTAGPDLVRDWEALSPLVHVGEPSNRGPVVERLLDHLDPVFEDRLPPNGYVHGPAGTGKSAVVTALFEQLAAQPGAGRSVMYTTTRAEPRRQLQFVTVDGRTATSEFAFFRSVLDGLVAESVPEHGVGTAEVHDRIVSALRGTDTGAVVAVDHVGEAGSLDAESLVELVAELPSNTSWLAVGRTPPAETLLSAYTGSTVAFDPYDTQVLVDVLTTRAATGLTRRGLPHEAARRIAEWADGDAHDALAALFVAADRAVERDDLQITPRDVDDALDAVPRPSVSVSRLFALPTNKRRVVRALTDLSADERCSVSRTTTAVTGHPLVDLSENTVERFLYELAELGVVERVRAPDATSSGRPPSRVELRFAPTLFRRLYDRRR
ncbi:Cdc6/Cdc18 family protein [Halobaculum sp. MBLA0147]|uniref:Cdc6/Cdc18 family protein n=1 Tax=Halobaculum sp. MBLA0147 TaxID=3079934 RepID=UPI003524A846